jgi:hypothetical protein
LKTHLQATFVLFLLSSLLLSACGPGQVFGPTFTPIPTPTPTPIPTATAPASSSGIPLNCDDGASVVSGLYRAENNTWGKGTLSGWSQCIGLRLGPDGTLAGSWTWNWLNSGTNVKAYPEIIFGQKPGTSTTSPDLPAKISSVGALTMAYDFTSTHTGSGNIAFDIWLTNTQDSAKWGVSPITHEIMIWLGSYGGMRPGGHWVEQVKIDGTLFDVYTAEKWGDGWRYIAFAPAKNLPGAGSLNLVSFLSYMQGKSITTGDEYIASIEFGNEVAGGAGETTLNKYAVSLTSK